MCFEVDVDAYGVGWDIAADVEASITALGAKLEHVGSNNNASNNN